MDTVYYCIPLYKSEEDADNDIFYVKNFHTWQDVFFGTYDECCDFLYGKKVSYYIPVSGDGYCPDSPFDGVRR